ncbi:10-carbomethoxy-13-deoxycarminomycin esterase/esterase [Nocardia tenerifensis]|uniref:10-carbomethoxy-13-deoxycarminomycin esterase/esterase n=1 Tax=Nocardia tenerifensis TaxID=228006 RepID=A0A318JV04_9NOCA|nr:alpha/beta fold hydrolase [Nocardia tenerifensis]PXX59764.1 10-carbomethoxy-13-deoxycarminomycin esterase/esterase [Nocardia tenerifensis]
MAERVVSTADLQLWTEDFGDPGDPPLLLLGAHSSRGWPDEFVELLAANGLHVIRYDHRDTGRTVSLDADQKPYTFYELAADAIAVLDGWGIDRVHLVCFALGAATGQLMAIDYPDRLRSLTMTGAAALTVDFFTSCHCAYSGEPTPSGLPAPRREALDLIMGSPILDDVDAELDRRVELARVLSGSGLPFDPAEFRRWEEREIAHSGIAGRNSPNIDDSADITGRGSELANVTAPTLVIQGPLDPVHQPPHSAFLADSIPGGRLLELPGLGHTFPTAVHRALVDAIVEHVRRAEEALATA